MFCFDILWFYFAYRYYFLQIWDMQTYNLRVRWNPRQIWLNNTNYKNSGYINRLMVPSSRLTCSFLVSRQQEERKRRSSWKIRFLTFVHVVIVVAVAVVLLAKKGKNKFYNQYRKALRRGWLYNENDRKRVMTAHQIVKFLTGEIASNSPFHCKWNSKWRNCSDLPISPVSAATVPILNIDGKDTSEKGITYRIKKILNTLSNEQKINLHLKL